MNLDAYRPIVGDELITKIYKSAFALSDKHLMCVNSTCLGGGVAEILNSLVPLMNESGIETGWRVLHGSLNFFNITKKFHNALQGERLNLSPMKKKLYEECNRDFSTYTHIGHDCVIIHDYQPLPLIKFYKKRQYWIWRCHIDLSNPNKELWDYLKGFILKYDIMIVSDEKYKGVELVPQVVIRPAIDPLSPKNMELKDETIKKYLKKYKVPLDKPIISYVSRFDKWKDPEGTIEVFKRVKEKIDCRLILCGNFAHDDPEGEAMYGRVLNKIKATKDVSIVFGIDPILVNALQRVSKVVIQKSTREGFALTVAEALWKGTPVVGSNIGGIPSQIVDGKTGFLVEPTDLDGCADKVITLLKDSALRKEIGKSAKEYIRVNFLLPRLLLDYIELIKKFFTK